MYKAIIADDENKICQLIKSMGNWEELGIEVVDICHSGDDALESIQEYDPDIVLTDIRMPVYDGLQIISEVNKRYGMNRSICFIIISGYAEFEYARQAIQYNIVNYLLKPLDKGQLNEALQKACNSLNRKQQQMETQMRLKENQRWLQAGCVTLLQQGSCQEPLGEEELNKKYCTSFEAGFYQGLFLNFPFSISEEENLFLKTFMEKMRVHFAFCFETVLKTEGTGIYVVINYPREEQGRLRQATQEFYKSICAIAKDYGEFQIYMGIGREVPVPAEVCRSLQEAEMAEMSRLLYADKKVLAYDSLEEDARSLYDLLTMKRLKELEPLLGRLNAFEVKKWFSETSLLLEKESGSLKSARILLELEDAVGSIVRGVLLEFEKTMVEGFSRDLHLSLKQAANFSNYLWIMKTKTVLLVEQIAELVSRQESHPVYAAKQFIQQNFHKPITLSQVAEQLNFSSVYFGNMFKKHTGKSFNEYLTDVRMENAKKLLKMPEYTVSQAADRVGYQDVKYFSKIFKAAYGIKPSEYKKMITSLHAHNLNI